MWYNVFIIRIRGDKMRRVLGVMLLVIAIVFPLGGCAEEIPLPTDRGDFGITMEDLAAGLEEKRLWREENMSDVPGFDEEKGCLNFKRKEIEGIEKYTAKNAGMTIEVFCTEGKIYCVTLSGDVNRKTMVLTNTNIEEYGRDLEAILERDGPSEANSPDINDIIEEDNMFILSDGEVKEVELEWKLISYRAERKGDKLIAVFTPYAI